MRRVSTTKHHHLGFQSRARESTAFFSPVRDDEISLAALALEASRGPGSEELEVRVPSARMDWLSPGERRAASAARANRNPPRVEWAKAERGAHFSVPGMRSEIQSSCDNRRRARWVAHVCRSRHVDAVGGQRIGIRSSQNYGRDRKSTRHRDEKKRAETNLGSNGGELVPIPQRGSRAVQAVEVHMDLG